MNHFLKVGEVVYFSIGTEVNLHTDSIMAEKTITFNDVPEAMTYLIEKFDRLENLIESAVSPKTDEVQWLDIDALCEYLPDKPAKQTVYGWVCKKTIPFHKKGKKLQFLKSEIDRWLLSDEAPPEEQPEVFRISTRRRKNY